MQVNTDGLINIPFDTAKCWDLVTIVYARMGIVLPNYTVANDATEQIAAIYNQERSGWKKIEHPVPGALIAFALDPAYPQLVQHFGVCLGRNFIHTLKKINSCIMPMKHRFFANKMKGFYEWIAS